MKQRKTSSTDDPGRPQKAADGRDSAGHGRKEPVVRDRAILALLNEPTVAKAAAQSGIGERTLRRWLAEDEGFQAAYAAARQTVFQVGINRVQALTPRAIQALEELVGERKYPHVRLAAARTIAELAIRQHDAETIVRRLEEIEARQREYANLGRA